MDTITTTQQPLNLKTVPQPPPSIAELRHISAALSQFLRDYDDLHNHIGFVNSAIDEKLSVHFEGTAVNFNDFSLTPLIDSTNNNSVRNVLEGSVVERNPKVNVSECFFSDDDNVIEGVVSERKRNECVVDDDDDNNVLEGVVSERKRNECVVDDDVRMHASSDTFIKDSDFRVVNDVLEGVVLEGKGEGTESECEQSDEGMKNYEKNDCDGVVEGVVVMEGKCEGSESESESERSYEDMRMYESDCDGLEGVVVTEGKCEGSVSESESESESECERSDDDMRMYESDCDGVVNDVVEGVVVTEGKCEGSESESECERSDEDVMMYESTNYVKKREESDCDRVVNDVLEGVVLEEKPKGDESDFKRRNEDVKNDEEVDASVKMEESDCAKIITDVPKAVVSDESSKGTVIECEQSDDDVKMCESPKYSTSCEETDDEGEEIDATNNADDEGEKIDASKNVEETDYDRAIHEFLEEISVIEKNPIRTASKCDKVRTPQRGSSLENSEETDDEDGEIEASKKPEDADYDRIVTELLEDIDVVPKPNRTASDSDESFDKPQSPTSSKNCEETDVSMNPDDTDISKNHRETAVSMEPGEIDILNDTVETDESEKHDEIDIPANPVETDVSEKPEEIDTAKNPEETDVPEKPENVEILKDPKPAVSELERLCKSMSGREMKEYVVKHISDIDKLQKELLKALKLAINPAKLVLDSIGPYFLQSDKTYKSRKTYNRYMNDQMDETKASVLILGCFVMISGDGIEISREDVASAAEDANRWKNRMIKEGGLKQTDVADARGLLLLISGFGISDRHFSIVDIMDLMMASNVKGISNILRRSIVLMPKIPEIIDTMIMKKLEVDAADLAYTFGLEDKCHALTILRKFLRNISGSPVQLEAMKQQLDDLISVKECLESHNIDPSKVLPEFKIAEKIHHLKKELKVQKKKKELKLQFPVQKRKAMDIESLPNPNHQEAKRTCSSHKTMPRGISSYNQSMQPGYSYHYFNPNLSSNYVTTYSSSSLLNAPALPVNITNSVPSGLAGPGGNIRSYGWQDDSDCSELVEKYLPRQSQTYDSQPYDCQDDSALVEKYLPRHSQTYDLQPSSTGLLGRRPEFPVCMPGHPGYPGYFPSGGFPARRGPGSDLYGFADVVEKERRGPGSDLYGFADVVEKERRGSRAVGSGTARY